MPGREDPRIVVNESKGSGYPIKPLHGGIEMIDADELKSQKHRRGDKWGGRITRIAMVVRCELRKPGLAIFLKAIIQLCGISAPSQPTSSMRP
jgi:hypothetical protein